MPRKKLFRLEAVKTLAHIVEYDPDRKIVWSEVFLNNHDIILELGCGRGELAIGLAEIFPDKNIIGIDKKADRLWFGGKAAEEKKLKNVCFLRMPIEKITEAFAKNEISEIWITFPDPFPRRRDAKRRLVSPEFLERYRKILKSPGILRLKTDAQSLYEYTLEVLHKQQMKPRITINDLYAEELCNLDATLIVQTTYEKKHLAQGKKIFYVESQLTRK